MRPPPMQAPRPATATTRPAMPCRYYALGTCTRGDQCWYAHDGPMVSVAPLPPPTNDYAAATEAERLHALEGAGRAKVAAEPEETLCVICYETPKEFGLLDCCVHIFCTAYVVAPFARR